MRFSARLPPGAQLLRDGAIAGALFGSDVGALGAHFSATRCPLLAAHFFGTKVGTLGGSFFGGEVGALGSALFSDEEGL